MKPRRPIPTLAIALLAAASCAGPGGPGGAAPAPGEAPAPPAVPGSRVVRCHYDVDGVERSLDVAPEDLGLSPDLLRRLLAPPREEAAPLPAARAWDVVLDDTPGAILRLEDRGGESLWVLLPGSAEASQASFPELLAVLRRIAVDALAGSMAPPRAPLDWQSCALVDLWSLAGVEVSLSGPRLIEMLERAADPAPLVLRVLRRLDAVLALEGADLGRFAQDQAVARRVLSLAAAARGGSEASLSELLRLAFEYFGESPLFAAATRAVVPPELNPGLHRRFPSLGAPPHAIAFLKEVQSRLGEAAFVEGKGWRLDGPPS